MTVCEKQEKIWEERSLGTFSNSPGFKVGFVNVPASQKCQNQIIEGADMNAFAY